MEVAEPEQEQLGRYRLERTLGAGGMGVVYLARDTRLQRQVAIKKLRKDATSDSAGARIQSEAQLLARLNHPHVVQLYDVLEECGGIALVMEYVEGTTLREWMREHSAPLRDKLGLLMQICKGLSQAHTLGIIHRDLKPDNILITLCGTAKITDFGIAKSQREDTGNITREDHVAGTVEAMSPEQLRGLPLCPRTDLFSLGAVAYELLCGAKPFGTGEGGSLALAHRVVSEPHIPPQQAWAGIPEPLAALLDRLLAKNPGQRPESAQQVYEALDFLYQHQTDDTDTREFSDTVTQLLRKPPNRRRRIATILTGLALLAGTGYWGWKEITRLEPQYIAVLPVEIRGEVRGEENAEALTAAMVRQALMNATSQLKASALVSFTPKEGQDFDAQLQALRDKGVTDALFARLECARVRCEIELQRIEPGDSRIKGQVGFAFLVDKRQEAEYRIGNSAAALFPQNYVRDSDEQVAMSDKDYNDYLSIVSRLESKENAAEDLQRLENLLKGYPKNPNLYRIFTEVATDLFVLTDEETHIQSGLDMLEVAKDRDINPNLILELELWLRTYSADKSLFDSLLKRIDKQKAPSAALLAKYSRFLFTQGDYEAGLRYAQEASALNPSADSLYLVAMNQTASGNYTAARTTLNDLTKTYPLHWSSYSLLGVIELESGNLAAAEAAIITIPEDLRGWRTSKNLGVAYFLQKKYTDALEQYQKILAKIPNNTTIKSHIAETHVMLGEVEKARKHYLELIKLTKNDQDFGSMQIQAQALANIGERGEAIALLHKLLKKSPDDTYVQYTAAQVYALLNEWSSANFYTEQLLQQGMSAEWFNLPAFQKLCSQSQISNVVAAAICD